MALKFHWMLPKAYEVVVNAKQTSYNAAKYRRESVIPGSISSQPDLLGWQHFAQQAEQAGIDSVLISFGRFEPEPLMVAASLGMLCKKLKFICAFRAGLTQPAFFTQQVNSLSHIIDGRVSLNLVVGSSVQEQQGYGDFFDHDSRYQRAGEFLSICHQFWQADTNSDYGIDFNGEHYQIAAGRIATPFAQGTRPDIFVSGHSSAATELVTEQGDCWVRVIDTPEKLAPQVAQMKALGKRVCLRLGIICRDTRTEALAVLDELLTYTTEQGEIAGSVKKQDSQLYREVAKNQSDQWLSEHIFAGFTADCSPVWMTLVGTPQTIAEQIICYRDIGVTEFIISGWPEVDEVKIFGDKVMPLVNAH